VLNFQPELFRHRLTLHLCYLSSEQNLLGAKFQGESSRDGLVEFAGRGGSGFPALCLVSHDLTYIRKFTALEIDLRIIPSVYLNTFLQQHIYYYYIFI